MSEGSPRELYAEEKILITGGTELVSITVIEKLLRICPGLGTIYVLMKQMEGGESVQKRWEDVCKSQLFEKLRRTRPELINKVILIEEDLTGEGLGIPGLVKEELMENITVAFHITPEVQQSDDLNKILLNGLKETIFVCDFLKEFKHLKSLIYILPIFKTSIEEFEEAEEEEIPIIQDWRTVLKLQEAQPLIMHDMKEKIVHSHQNASSWSRAISEQVVRESSVFYPTATIRPVIIPTASKKDPKETAFKISFTSEITSHTKTVEEAVSDFVSVCRADPDNFIEVANSQEATDYEIEQRKRAHLLRTGYEVRNALHGVIFLAFLTSIGFVLKYTLT